MTIPRGTKLPSPTLNRSAAATAAAARNLPAYSRAGYAAERDTCPPHRSADPGLTLARPGAPSRFDDHLGPSPAVWSGVSVARVLPGLAFPVRALHETDGLERSV